MRYYIIVTIGSVNFHSFHVDVADWLFQGYAFPTAQLPSTSGQMEIDVAGYRRLPTAHVAEECPLLCRECSDAPLVPS